MANYNQAPQLLSVGEKNQTDNLYPGFAQRNHFLEYGIMNCLGERDFAMFKIMMFLTGNQANVGFKVPENTICQACGINATTYKNNRKKLVALGWIEHKDSQYIKVNYDKIYSDIKQKLGYIQNTSIQGDIKNTPLVKKEKLGYIQNTSILVEEKKQKDTPIFEGVYSEYPNFDVQYTSKGYIQNTHNNIIEQNKEQNNLPILLYSQIQELFVEGSYEIRDGVCYKEDGKKFKVEYDF